MWGWDRLLAEVHPAIKGAIHHFYDILNYVLMAEPM